MQKLKVILSFLLLSFSSTKVISQPELIRIHNQFSLRMHKALKEDSANLFISPLSLHLAFALANEGASGSTKEEINRFIGIDEKRKYKNNYNELITTTLNLYDVEFSNCLDWLKPKGESSNTLLIGNSAWINDRFNIYDQFKYDLENNLKANIFSFSDQKIEVANRNMSFWVSNQTKDKILEAGELKKSTVMRLVNVIYFNGIWDIPFDEGKTSKKNFHRLNKEKVKINFMQNQAYLKYFEDNTMQMLSLPYLCEQFTMLVLLPRDRYGILNIEDSLSINYLDKARNSSFRHEVILSFPKFKIDTELSPKDQIIKLGYNNMFSDNADFSGISSTQLKISEIIHKTTIEVSEEKTEAAAVSSMEIVVTGYGGGVVSQPPPPKIFNANHPFMFFILDNRTQAILFTGRFVGN